MQIQKDTYRQQSDLAKYCRTDILSGSLKVRKERVHHYRRLVYNVIDDSLIAAYPLLHNLISEEQWKKLVNDFFATHACQSTQVWKMPGEFYEYIKTTDLQLKTIFPQLHDLIYFEWIEVELFMMEDVEYPLFKNEGDWVNDIIAVNPEHKIIRFNYPVHFKNSKSISKADKGEYFLLAYREKETGKVQFSDISALFAVIIENIAKGLTLNEILWELNDIMKINNPGQIIEQVVPFFMNLKKKGFLPGFVI